MVHLLLLPVPVKRETRFFYAQHRSKYKTTVSEFIFDRRDTVRIYFDGL
jgi:hypothetical protein